MRALIQRVSNARVEVAGRETGSIGRGLLIFLGVAPADTPKESAYLAGKCARLRVFPDEAGKMNHSLLDLKEKSSAEGGAALVVSQFTLYGDTRKGNRPAFTGAAPPQLAERLYTRFIADLEGLGLTVASGEFAADMAVSLVNDGPVTLLLEKEADQNTEAQT